MGYSDFMKRGTMFLIYLEDLHKEVYINHNIILLETGCLYSFDIKLPKGYLSYKRYYKNVFISNGNFYHYRNNKMLKMSNIRTKKLFDGLYKRYKWKLGDDTCLFY